MAMVADEAEKDRNLLLFVVVDASRCCRAE
jgi:hypothetical protein